MALWLVVVKCEFWRVLCFSHNTFQFSACVASLLSWLILQPVAFLSRPSRFLLPLNFLKFLLYFKLQIHTLSSRDIPCIPLNLGVYFYYPTTVAWCVPGKILHHMDDAKVLCHYKQKLGPLVHGSSSLWKPGWLSTKKSHEAIVWWRVPQTCFSLKSLAFLHP